MSFALEFHDSELGHVVADGGAVRLRFSAAAVRNDTGERGWLASVVLTLAQATLTGDAAHAFGKITEGALRRDGAAAARLALPGTLSGPLELTLRFANGSQLVVAGQALEASLGDDARLTEDLSC